MDAINTNAARRDIACHVDSVAVGATIIIFQIDAVTPTTTRRDIACHVDSVAFGATTII